MIRHLNPPTLGQPKGYTHIVETRGARTVYISGQVAEDTAGNVVGVGEFSTQARQVFENLKLALEAVGATFEDLAKTTTYVLSMSELGALREIRAEYLGPNPPANTLVEVNRLAHPDYLIEIEGVVVLGPAQE